MTNGGHPPTDDKIEGKAETKADQPTVEAATQASEAKQETK